MEIEHQRRAGVLDAPGQLRRVFEPVHAVAGIHPEAQPKTGPAVLHENCQRVARLVAIKINAAVTFDIREGGNVRAQAKWRPGGRRHGRGIVRCASCDDKQSDRGNHSGVTGDAVREWEPAPFFGQTMHDFCMRSGCSGPAISPSLTNVRFFADRV